jgi:hypothetical protein
VKVTFRHVPTAGLLQAAGQIGHPLEHLVAGFPLFFGIDALGRLVIPVGHVPRRPPDRDHPASGQQDQDEQHQQNNPNGLSHE